MKELLVAAVLILIAVYLAIHLQGINFKKKNNWVIHNGMSYNISNFKNNLSQAENRNTFWIVYLMAAIAVAIVAGISPYFAGKFHQTPNSSLHSRTKQPIMHDYYGTYELNGNQGLQIENQDKIEALRTRYTNATSNYAIPPTSESNQNSHQIVVGKHNISGYSLGHLMFRFHFDKSSYFHPYKRTLNRVYDQHDYGNYNKSLVTHQLPGDSYGVLLRGHYTKVNPQLQNIIQDNHPNDMTTPINDGIDRFETNSYDVNSIHFHKNMKLYGSKHSLVIGLNSHNQLGLSPTLASTVIGNSSTFESNYYDFLGNDSQYLYQLPYLRVSKHAIKKAKKQYKQVKLQHKEFLKHQQTIQEHQRIIAQPHA